ncbi:hypothetical protein FD755_017127, partial [Muntiacus reevesi]
LNKNPVEGFSEGLIDDNDLYQWEVLIIALPDTLYKDKYCYEKPEECWLPIHTVEIIMISVISMLEWREDRNGEVKRKVTRCVRKSQKSAFE